MHLPTRLRLAAAFAFAGVAWTTHGADPTTVLLGHITAAHQQNYDALEQAPTRHWGELNQLSPLNDLRHALRNRRSPAQAGEAAAQRFNAIYDAFAEQLGLTPAGDLVVEPADGIAAVPRTIECAAFVDVPAALVLRVKADDWSEPIVISPIAEAGVDIAGQTLTPAGRLTLFAVLPFGLRTQDEAGEVVPGTPESAPAHPRLVRIFAINTAVASCVFAIFWLLVTQGWVDPETFPFQVPIKGYQPGSG